jgi:hypothetical protein
MAGTSSAKTRFALLPGHDDGTDAPRVASRCSALAAKNFFIIFVDAIFTILLERLFTNVFDVIAETIANPCLYPMGNAD